MARSVDTRLTLLETMARDTGKVVVLDNIIGVIYYIDDTGDYHEMTYKQYQDIKDEVTTVRLSYAKTR